MLQLGAAPTLGAICGSSGTSDLLNQINQELGSSDFFNSVDDILIKSRKAFVENFVVPIRAIGNTIKNALGDFKNINKIIPITSEDLLQEIPSCMHMAVMQHEPVRKLFDQGRIFGFGYNCVPEGDPYGRLINNGSVPDVLEAMDKEGYVEFVNVHKSTDPELSFDELDAIEESRDFIDQILNETDIDVTDAPNSRG